MRVRTEREQRGRIGNLVQHTKGELPAKTRPATRVSPATHARERSQMAQRRRNWVSVLVILLIVAMAASWGTLVAPARAQEPVNIQFWSTAWFPSSIAGRQQLVDKFNQE